MVLCLKWLSTDIWTSIATQAYITVSAHFISPLNTLLLQMMSFPENHNAENIKNQRDPSKFFIFSCTMNTRIYGSL